MDNRTVVTLLISWRVSGLVTGLAAVIAGRKRYRSQVVARGTAGGRCARESVWLTRRLEPEWISIRSTVSHDRSGHRSDCTFVGPDKFGFRRPMDMDRLGAVELPPTPSRDGRSILTHEPPACLARRRSSAPARP